METILILDKQDYDQSLPRVVRRAVRGIVVKDGRLAMIRSKYGDYKFPGGGAEEGEGHTDTLAREIAEETGLTMIPGSCRPWGESAEIRLESYGGSPHIFEQHSFYYLCEVEDGAGGTKRDQYEIDLEYTLAWVTPEEIVTANRAVPAENKLPWTERDTRVVELLEKKGLAVL